MRCCGVSSTNVSNPITFVPSLISANPKFLNVYSVCLSLMFEEDLKNISMGMSLNITKFILSNPLNNFLIIL